MSPEAAELLASPASLNPETVQILFAFLCAVLCAGGIYLGRRWGGP